MAQLRLALLTLGTSNGNIYITPTGDAARVEVVRFSTSTAANLTLKLEETATTLSYFILNAVPVPANSSFEVRDLYVPSGWKLTGFASASGVDCYVGGVVASPAPTNPAIKVLGRTGLSGTMTDIYVVPSGKRAVIKHLTLATAGSDGTLSIQYETAGGTTKNYRNTEVVLQRTLTENFDINLNQAGDKIRASGTGDLILLGLEFNV